MNPRPYQVDCCNSVESGWDEFTRQLAVLPTGAGKTIISAILCRKWVEEGHRVLFLAHRFELLQQTIDKFHRAAGIHAELEKAEAYASHEADVVVGSIQTFARRGIERFDSDHFTRIVVDEAHHTPADSYRNVLALFPEAKVLGITATPDRADKRNLGSMFDRIAYEITLFDLIHQGYLSPICIKAIPVQIDLSKVRQTAGDFNEADLGEAIGPYLDRIAEVIRDEASFRKVLCFLPLIATSKRFVEACAKAGLTAAHVDGESPDRDEIRKRFAAGEFDVLSNAMLYTEGFDDPSIDCVVVLRPTQSRGLYTQMVGRGTRIHPGKSNLLLLDFAWLHERHKLVKPAHLIAKSDEEAEIMTRVAEEQQAGGGGEQDLEALAGIATTERENSLLKRLRDQQKKQTKYISAEEFALNHHQLEIAEFEPVFSWQKDAITDAQARVLKGAKIDPATVRGKGHASALIGLIRQNDGVTLASPAQRWKMRQMGHPNADLATVADARRFFSKR